MHESRLPVPYPILSFIVLFMLALAAYAVSLNNPFMVDDHAFFSSLSLKNIKLLPLQLIPDVYKVLEIESAQPSVYYRPLAHIVPMLQWAAFKNMVWGYHLTNLALFVTAAWIANLFVLYLFKDRVLAFLTAAFFVIHPINNFLPNYITAGHFGLQVALMILSVWTLFRAEDGGKRGTGPVILSCLYFLLALLAHETTLALPFFLFGFAFFVQRKSFKTSFKFSRAHFATLAGYLVFRFFFASLKSTVLDKTADVSGSIFEFAASFAKVCFWYLSNLIYPNDIVLMWVTPLVTEHVHWWLLLLIAAGALALFLVRRAPDAVVRTGILWLFVGFIPVLPASIHQSHAGIMIEPHWLLFSSLGFCLLVAAAFQRLGTRKIAYALLTLLFACWLFLTHVHNYFWKSEIRYCRFWLSQAPHLKNVRFFLASAYMRAGYDLAAERYFLQSINNDYRDWQIFSNLGIIYYHRGLPDKALENYEKALAINPDSAALINNIGLVHLDRKDYARADETFERALRLNPFFGEIRLNLAASAKAQGEWEKAVRFYKDNLAIAPHDERTLFHLTETYLKNNRIPDARSSAQTLIANATTPVSVTDLGALLAAHNMVPLSLECFQKAIMLDPSYPPAYIEGGKLLANMGYRNEAAALWAEGLKNNPESELMAVYGTQAKQGRPNNLK